MDDVACGCTGVVVIVSFQRSVPLHYIVYKHRLPLLLTFGKRIVYIVVFFMERAGAFCLSPF